MKKFLLLSLIVMIGLSCGDGLIKKKVFRDDGTLQQLISMDKDSTLQGHSFTYYENGEDIFEKANYFNGELSGVRELFYPDGNIEIRETYSADVLVDTLFTFHANGNMKTKSYYDNGTLTGVATKYYESGSLNEEVTFEYDEENGPFKEYHENGQLKWTGTYAEGDNEVGLLTEFNEEGEAIKKLMCDDRSICKTIWTIEKGDIVDIHEDTN